MCIRALTASRLPMLRTTTHRVLCPFLYPSACRRSLHEPQSWRARRSLTTSAPRTKAPEPSTSTSTAAASVPLGTSIPRTKPNAGKPQGSSSAGQGTVSKADDGSPSDKDAKKLPKMPTVREAVRAAEKQINMEEEELKKPLEILRRPVGVPNKPTTKSKSWKEMRAELLDGNAYVAEHNHLVKEMVRGGLRDVHLLKYHGGKMWIGPPSLIRQDLALYFPNVSGTPLDRSAVVHTTDICADKVSVITFAPVQIASHHCSSFMKLTLDTFENDPDFCYVQINLQENYLKSLLVSMFTSRLRRQIPEQQHSTYLLSSQNMEYLREPLGMINKHIGYVYLVDQQLRIRWAGCGFAEGDEQIALHQCVGVLLKRLKAKSSSSSPPPSPQKS